MHFKLTNHPLNSPSSPTCAADYFYIATSILKCILLHRVSPTFRYFSWNIWSLLFQMLAVPSSLRSSAKTVFAPSFIKDKDNRIIKNSGFGSHLIDHNTILFWFDSETQKKMAFPGKEYPCYRLLLNLIYLSQKTEGAGAKALYLLFFIVKLVSYDLIYAFRFIPAAL